MTEWSQPDQAERFVREYADPILAGVRRLLPGPLGRPGHLSGYFLTCWKKHGTFDTPGPRAGLYPAVAPSTPCKDILKSSRFRRTAPLEEAERVAAPGAGGGARGVAGGATALPPKDRILDVPVLLRGLQPVRRPPS